VSTVSSVDLVLDSGELVRIECPSKHEDDLYETLEAALKRRDWWSVRQWDGAHALFMGHRIDRVNMARVVAML
jgi:hypothetical protein